MRNLLVITGLLLLLLTDSSFAQQRPLVTEDPETVGEGQVLVEAGLDYARDVTFPVSGLTGNLRRMPLLGVSVGISSIAEIQIDGGLWNHLSIDERAQAPLADAVTATGSTTSSLENLVIGTKLQVLSESSSRPGVGLRFATELPLASNESGLGFDTTNFFLSLLAAKTIESVRVVSNVGMAILGGPTRGDQQNRVLTYGVSFARAATQSTEVVGELNGLANLGGSDPTPGTESQSTFRFGARHTRGTIRADAALLFGITTNDPSFGVTAGLTYVFNAFQTP